MWSSMMSQFTEELGYSSFDEINLKRQRIHQRKSISHAVTNRKHLQKLSSVHAMHSKNLNLIAHKSLMEN